MLAPWRLGHPGPLGQNVKNYAMAISYVEVEIVTFAIQCSVQATHIIVKI